MAHCRHEKFIIMVGSGANGKSVLLSVLEALAGPENVAGVQPSQFDRSFQRAHLHGKLANIVTEIKQGEMIDDASLKGIVSGEPTSVEHKFKDPFVMRPFSTCWFGTNHMPHTRDFSDALFRRALVVEFNNKFKPEMGNCDPQLKDKQMGELPGILSLALDAYADALVSGFTMPESCQQARERWRLEADQVAQFVGDECERVPDSKIRPQSLYDAYKEWAEENGIHKRLGQKQFGDRLVMLGFERKKSDGARYITGVKCTRAVDFRSYP
jgi:putative DNA primase/helicase